MRDRRAQIEAAGIAVVAVGFSPLEALADLAAYLDWPWPFLCDRERVLYRRLGLPRLPLWRVYSAGTLLRYARALVRRRPLHRPVEDTRQIGGDAVVRKGAVVRLFVPRSPDDRASVPLLIEAARSLMGEP